MGNEYLENEKLQLEIESLRRERFSIIGNILFKLGLFVVAVVSIRYQVWNLL